MMKRQAQAVLSEKGQYVLNQYEQLHQQFEALSPVTIGNYLGDPQQAISLV